MNDQPDIDLSSEPAEVLDEILRLGEACLADTIQLALAADQRGMTVAGIFGAGSVALLAAAATVAIGSPLFVAFLATAVCFFVATLFCAWAARPRDFFIGGYEPQLFKGSTGDLPTTKRFVAVDVQRRISRNRDALKAAARGFNAGVIVGGVAPLLGVAAYVLTMNPCPF